MISGLVAKNHSTPDAFCVMVRPDAIHLQKPMMFRSRYPTEDETLEQYLCEELGVPPSAIVSAYKCDEAGIVQGSPLPPKALWSECLLQQWMMGARRGMTLHLLLIVNSDGYGKIMEAMVPGSVESREVYKHIRSRADDILAPPIIPSVGGFLIQPRPLQVFLHDDLSLSIGGETTATGTGRSSYILKVGEPVEINPSRVSDDAGGAGGAVAPSGQNRVAELEALENVYRVHLIGYMFRNNKHWIVHGGVFTNKRAELISGCNRLATYGYEPVPIVEFRSAAFASAVAKNQPWTVRGDLAPLIIMNHHREVSDSRPVSI